MLRNHAALLGLALVAAAFVTAAPAASGEDCQRTDVSLHEDTCGTLLAASLTGDARGTDCRKANTCIAVSGTGNASNEAGRRTCQVASDVCLAVSGTGNASNEAGDGSCNSGCVAVAGTGNASNEAGYRSCNAGCLAVSATGDASNTAGHRSCGYGTSAGCLALTGTGNASNEAESPGCQAGCVALTGTGEATNGGSACEAETSCLALSASTLLDEHLPVEE